MVRRHDASTGSNLMIQLFLLLLVLSVGACSQDANEEMSPAVHASKSYEDAYTSAVAAISIAAEKGHAWTTSDVLLEQAASAAANGDEKLAIQLADDARMYAALAASQAESEATAWRDRVVAD